MAAPVAIKAGGACLEGCVFELSGEVKAMGLSDKLRLRIEALGGRVGTAAATHLLVGQHEDAKIEDVAKEGKWVLRESSVAICEDRETRTALHAHLAAVCEKVHSKIESKFASFLQRTTLQMAGALGYKTAVALLLQFWPESVPGPIDRVELLKAQVSVDDRLAVFLLSKETKDTSLMEKASALGLGRADYDLHRVVSSHYDYYEDGDVSKALQAKARDYLERAVIAGCKGSFTDFGSAFGYKAASRLLAMNPPIEEIVIVWEGYSEDDWGKHFAEAFLSNSKLRSIMVFDRYSPEAEDIKHLFEALKVSKTLSGLFFETAPLSEEAAEIVGSALPFTQGLRSLSCGVSGDGLRHIGSGLALNTSLVDLHLFDDSRYGCESDELLNAMKSNTSLTSLAANIKGLDIPSLAKVLETNTTLLKLVLRGNVDDDGARALACMLRKNHTLTYLDMICGKIADEGAMALAKALEGRHVSLELRLRLNAFTTSKPEESGSSASAAIKALRSLPKCIEVRL